MQATPENTFRFARDGEPLRPVALPVALEATAQERLSCGTRGQVKARQGIEWRVQRDDAA